MSRFTWFLAFVAAAANFAHADTTTPRSLASLNVAVTEDFNGLVSSGTGTLSDNTPIGVGFVESGTNANATYSAGNGSAATGDTYGYGSGTQSDRALGGLLSGNLTPTLGIRFRNDTGATITSLAISYAGEQWRLGATGRADRLDFQISTTATALGGSGATGYSDVDALDFSSPVTSGTTGALDGNAAANRTAITHTIGSLSIAPNAEVWLRWTDFNASGADDGLAIDDFSITPQGSVSTTPPILAYTPVPGALNLPGGSLAAVVNSQITVTPSAGAGSGAAATTTLGNCSISGAGAAAFGAPTGLPMSFVGSTTTAQNLGLSCTLAAAAASASLSCDETQGLSAPVSRTWNLNCPATPDVPPTVASTSPADGATGVAATANVTVNFSEPVTTASGWFGLSCSSSGTVAYTESGSGNSRTIDPTPTLLAGESCIGTVESTLVTDLDGTADAMAADFSFSFTVAAGGGGTTTVTFTAPAQNQNPVRADGDVTVIFSQPVTLSAGAMTLSCSAGNISGVLSGEIQNRRYRFNPDSNMPNGPCTFTLVSSAISPGLSGGVNVTRSFTVGDYYASVNSSTDATLRSTLHPVIDDHTEFTYTPGVWDILEIADQAPDNFNQIIDVYQNRRFTKGTDRAGSGSNTYNREHTWPNSLGFSTNAPGPYTDTHMLYLSQTVYNSDRGNLPYRDCPNSGGAPCGERSTQNNPFWLGGTGSNQGIYPGTSNWVNASQFEVWSARKGDLARAVLYMDIRYEGTNGEINLEMGETTSTSGRMASLSTLRAWHAADPPDELERLRNDIVYAFQQNRNPFIDRPEFVECLYGNVCPGGSSTPPNLAYNPSIGATIALGGGAGVGSSATGTLTVTPSGGSGSGTAAISSLGSCSVTGLSGGNVSPATVSFIGSTTIAQSLTLSCSVQAAVQTGSLTCDETLGTGAPTSRSWPVSCPAALSGDVPPALAFDPAAGSTISFPSGSNGSSVSSSIVVTPSGGNGSGTAATTTFDGCSLSGAGAASFSGAAAVSLGFVGPSTTAQNATLSCTIGASVASATLSCTETRGGVAQPVRTWPLSCPAATGGYTPIAQIQGTAASSPLSGSVTTEGVVTARKSNAFIIQTPDAEADSDPNSSEAILIFTSSAPPAAAAVGNRVRVTGTILEFVPAADPNQLPITELTSPTVTLLSTGNPLPTPVALPSLAPGSPLGTLERLEFMRVTTPPLVVVQATAGTITESSATANSNGVFYATAAGATRPRREAGIDQHDPLPAGAPVGVPRFDANQEALRVDSDGQSGATALELSAGQTLSALTGVLDYGFRAYTLLPDVGSSPTIGAAPSPGVATARTASEFTVASYNLQRFFDNVDAPGISEPVLTTTAFNNRLQRASRQIRQNLGNPDVIGVVEVENLATLQALASQINSDAASAAVNYVAYLSEGNDVGGIDVGFLVNTAIVSGSTPRVAVSSVTQVGASATYINPGTGVANALNDRPPLILDASVNFAGGTAVPIVVIVNHLRSLNDIGNETASGSSTIGGIVRAKRRAQAEYLATLVQARQLANPGERLILLGDFNAFELNDGYVDVLNTILGAPAAAANVVLASADLVSPNLTRLADADTYSYAFGGSVQNLDHILISQGAMIGTTARRLEHVRINTDFPDSQRNIAANTRLSDHDPLVAYFTVPASSLPTLSFAVAPGTINEVGAPTQATLTATLSAPLASDLVVTPSVSGTASAADYTILPASITIAAGNLTGTALITAVDDSDIEASELLQLDVPANAAYNIGTGATLTILSEDGVAPVLALNPASGSTINLLGGSAPGTTASASVLVTPSGGSGTGAASTSTVSGCALSGPGAASFAPVAGLSLSFVGATTDARNLPVSCTRAALAATASLSCQVRIGTAAASTLSYTLNCPAAALDGDLIALAQTNLAYTQGFDTLQSGSFVSAMPPGWRFSETGTGADTTYRSSSGGDNAGDTYAYGPGSCDRALGTLLTSSVTSRIGACFVNNTGRTLNTLRIGYTGEHWRRGAASGSDQLQFQYLINPATPGVSDGAGTWINAAALDFSNPVVSGTANSAVDGNAAANRAARNADLTGLGIAAGQSFCLRWVDTDLAGGSDHGLAIDDFSLIAEPGPAPGPCSGLCVSDSSVVEGNSGTTDAVFTITLSSPAPVGGVQFDVRTAVDTARHFDNDYVYLEQSNLSIAEGSSSTAVTVQVIGDTRAEPAERFRLVVSNVRGSAVGDAVGVGVIDTDDAYELWQVQGRGDRTPLDGLSITTQGNVVTALRSNGFFMQTPAARSDVDPLTSDGVFVFTGGAPAGVSVGSLVNVTGVAQERFCSTQISATGAGNGYTVVGSGASVAAVAFNANRPSPNPAAPSCAPHPDAETANFECFENMLVSVANGFVQSGSQRFGALFSPPAIPSASPSDPAAETLVVAGGARVFREAGFAFPGFDPTRGYPDYNPADLSQVARVAQVPVASGAPQVFELDADALDVAGNRVFFGGETFSASGVLAYEFDDFELWPTTLTVNSPAYPRAAPAAAADELSIASLNLLRLYSASGTNRTTPPRCDGTTGTYDSYSTGASGVAEANRRRNKLVRYILEVMRSPDVLGVQEVENLAVLQAVATELNTRNSALGYSAYLTPGNDRSGINVGYLVRDGAGGATPRVSAVDVSQLGFNERLSVDNSCLHDRPPLLLRASFAGQDFSVINNHTRSLLDIDAPNADGARTRQKRFEQAQSIRALVDAELALAPANRAVVVVGDHNAYQFSDGWVDTIGIIRGVQRPALLASPAALPVSQQLVNAVDLIAPAERYSYLFDNAAQVLDHAMLNDDALSVYRGLTFVRNNVDAPAHSFGLAEGSCGPIDIQPGTGVSNANFGAAACTENVSDHEGFVLRLFGASTASLSVGAPAVTQPEGNSVNTIALQVALSGFPAGVSQLRIPVSIVGGSATPGIDFNLQGTPILLSGGTTTGSYSVEVLGDTLLEGDETIVLELGQAIDVATGQPAAVSIAPNAGRVTVTLQNDDGLVMPVPRRVGPSDRGSSGGDFVSQALSGAARTFRYVIEVPGNTDRLQVELYDADFGAGGATDPADVSASGSFAPGAQVQYQLLSPQGAEVARLIGTSAAPVGADGQWIDLHQSDAPAAGRYVLQVSVPDSVVDSNGYRVRARALPLLRGGGDITDLSIYSDGYVSLGHPASGVVGSTTETVYPYITEGCSARIRTFDFDSASTAGSSIVLNAPNAFSQTFVNAQLSGDGVWNTLTSNPFTTIDHANGYGLWSAAITIEGGGGTANQGTLYFDSTQGLSGSDAPSGNPAPAAFRVYQAENGGAPLKPVVRQRLFHVSGANPPSPGNPGLYRVSIAVDNPGSGAITFAAPERVLRALVPFGGEVRYQGGAQPSQGQVLSEPALGAAGEVVWNPGEVGGSSSAQLTYLIEIAPSVSGITAVTGVYASGHGTTARFLDASNSETRFGPLCELSINSAGTPVTTPVTLASMRSARAGAEVDVQFTVATQVGVAAYRLYEGTGDLRTPAGELLAASGDQLVPIEIRARVPITGNSFYLQVLDIDGSTQWFGPFTVGAVQGESPPLQAVDWTALRAEARLASTRLASQRSADGNKLRLLVERDGAQRVSGAELLARAPALAGADLADLRLQHAGRNVAFAIDSSDATLSADDTLWFIGSTLSRDDVDGRGWLYGSTRSYTLERGSGQRLTEAPASSFSGQPVETGLLRQRIERQSQYVFSSPLADPFLGERLLARPSTPAHADYRFSLPGHVGGDVRVVAELAGGADFAALDDHHAQLLAGTRVLAAVRFDGLSPAQLRGQLAVPAASELDLRVRIPGDNQQSFDLVHVDRVHAEYRGRLSASGGYWRSALRDLDAADSVFADGFGDSSSGNLLDRVVRVAGLDAGAQAWLLAGAQSRRLPIRGSSGSAEISVPGGLPMDAVIVAFSPAQAATPAAQPWLDDSALLDGTADYLVISHPQFAEGLAPLLAAKVAQGLSVKVARTDAIYQRFGAGHADPAAIQAYLREARQQLGTRFVLLVGGDSYDARNWLGSNSLSFVPTTYVNLHPVVRFGASDASYADTDGDGMPDLAIGRWPVRSQAELARVLDKSLRVSDNQRALAVADDRDVADAFSFKAISEQVLGELTPEAATRAYLDDLGPDAIRARILERVAANDRLVHYFGHSGPTTWTYPSPGLLSPSDVFAGVLSNSKPNVLVQWGCWNTFHVLPQYQTIAHAWLLGPNGAQAVIGASAITEASNDAVLARALARHLRTAPTLGEALLAAKRELAATRPDALDVLLGTSLLGDPALRY